MRRIVFGGYVFEPTARLLTWQGSPVHLTPKALKMLELLLESRPAAVSKVDLDAGLWPDAFVSEQSLASLVSELRKALEADGVAYVRTFYGFGYAFCGEATPLRPAAIGGEPPPCFLVQRGPYAGRFPVYQGSTVIGRASGCDVWLTSPTVSRRHAQISLQDGVATLEDLGSRHGTLVGGLQISGPVRIKDGCKIQFGAVRLTFRTCTAEEHDTDDPFQQSR